MMYPYCEKCGKLLKVALKNGWQPPSIWSGTISFTSLNGTLITLPVSGYPDGVCYGHEKLALPQVFYDAFKHDEPWEEQEA